MSSSLSRAFRFIVLAAGFSAVASFAQPNTAEPTTATANVNPLKTCVVSGGKLGSMGKPVAYVHKQTGQPDRTVMFCCKGCIRKFENEPATFLAKLDAAAAAIGITKQH